MDDTVVLTFWVTGIVFVTVNLFLAWVVVALSPSRRTRRRTYEPENKKLEWWLTIVTSIGVAAMLAPGPLRLGQVRRRPEGRRDRRGGRPAMALELPLPGQGRRARPHATRRSITPDNPFGARPAGPEGPRRRAGREPRAAPAGRPAGQGPAALEGRAAQLHRHAVPGQDGPRPRHDHAPVAHADRAGLVRDPVRGALRRRALRDARPRRRHEARRSSTPGSLAMPPSARRRRSPRRDPVAGAGQYAVCMACHGAATARAIPR